MISNKLLLWLTALTVCIYQLWVAFHTETQFLSHNKATILSNFRNGTYNLTIESVETNNSMISYISYHDAWFDDLLHSLRYHRLLTANVLSKESLWRNLSITERLIQPPHLRKKALVYCGWVAYWDMENLALAGGPAGEFVIWADLVSGLGALGYNVTVVSTIVDFWIVVRGQEFDVVLTDYDGLGTAENVGDFPRRHCKYFIIDGFGTQPEFNTQRGLDLKRILTPYEFDGSNSPVYFITPRHSLMPKNTPGGLLWAKEPRYVKRFAPTLRAAALAMPPLHTTYKKKLDVRVDYPVVNHGHMNKDEYLQLLGSCSFLLGVGQPLDGPTPLEAIALGTPFINPVLVPPITVKGKPTRFRYSSQHPFIERYLRPPYAYTIDITNLTLLRDTILEIKSRGPPDPYVPVFNTPEQYLRNLRKILGQECNVSSPPRMHPGNKVYGSFEEYVADGCGGGGCKGKARHSPYTQELLAKYQAQFYQQPKKTSFTRSRSRQNTNKVLAQQSSILSRSHRGKLSIGHRSRRRPS